MENVVIWSSYCFPASGLNAKRSQADAGSSFIFTTQIWKRELILLSRKWINVFPKMSNYPFTLRSIKAFINTDLKRRFWLIRDIIYGSQASNLTSGSTSSQRGGASCWRETSAKTSTFLWTTAWPMILVLFPLPTSLFFFVAFSPHLPHSSFPCSILDTTFICVISFHSPLDGIPASLCFHLFSSCIAPSLYLSVLYANLSLCLHISLFSAPLRLAHYFCSVVHSVWGWTRTPPWPPVRGERLSGTKTSIAPFSSPSSYPVIDYKSKSTNNMTL